MVMTDPRNPPAGGLVAVHQLLNSIDIDEEVEELRDPGSATAWLRAQGLIAAAEEVDAAGLARLVTVRDGLRALAAVNTGCPLDPAEAAALTALERAAVEVRLRPVLEGGGLRLEPAADGVDRAIARILAAVAAADLDGTWRRLKACRDETCRWVFYDASKNVSGAWCAMGSCGNRAKARRYRSRRKG
jgi:predicted RNA-binding Zn ribbon-like protein